VGSVRALGLYIGVCGAVAGQWGDGRGHGLCQPGVYIYGFGQQLLQQQKEEEEEDYGVREGCGWYGCQLRR